MAQETTEAFDNLKPALLICVRHMCSGNDVVMPFASPSSYPSAMRDHESSGTVHHKLSSWELVRHLQDKDTADRNTPGAGVPGTSLRLEIIILTQETQKQILVMALPPDCMDEDTADGS
ncbi:hypothetical protein AB1E18_001229 [Capra hircus]